MPLFHGMQTYVTYPTPHIVQENFKNCPTSGGGIDFLTSIDCNVDKRRSCEVCDPTTCVNEEHVFVGANVQVKDARVLMNGNTHLRLRRS